MSIQGKPAEWCTEATSACQAQRSDSPSLPRSNSILTSFTTANGDAKKPLSHQLAYKLQTLKSKPNLVQIECGSHQQAHKIVRKLCGTLYPTFTDLKKTHFLIGPHKKQRNPRSNFIYLLYTSCGPLLPKGRHSKA